MNRSLSENQTDSTTASRPSAGRQVQAVPALIMGSYITSLGAIRSLSRNGVTCYAVTPQLNYILKSRYYKPPPDGYPILTDSSKLSDYLKNFPVERAVLIPCDDHWLQAVAEIREAVSDRFPTSMCGPEVLSRFVDKASFLQLLEETGVPHPPTYPLGSIEALELIKEKADADWFLKPADSQAFRMHYGCKAFRVRSYDDAVTRLEDATAAGYKMLLQEYISGPSSNHYFIDGFVDRHHEVKSVLTRNRRRMFPLDFGDSSYVVTVPHEEVAETVEIVKKMLRAVDFRGIFSVEFKRDVRDGQLKIIELNARAWAYIEFASQCGVDIAWMAYLDALEQEVPSIDPGPAVKSLCFMPNDFFAFLDLRRRGQLSTLQWIKSWWQAESTVFSWSDPAPSIKCWIDMGAAKLRRLMGRSQTA
jgi:predicted ATP-grasp superfamily ATP-dependent carboligase